MCSFDTNATASVCGNTTTSLGQSSASGCPQCFHASTSGTGSAGHWFADTGASHHVTPEVSNVKESVDFSGPGKLLVRDGKGLCISKIGTACLHSNSRDLLLRNLLLVPQITKNLISVSKCARDNGVYFEFHAGYCTVRDESSGEELIRGVEVDGLYTFANKFPSVSIAETCVTSRHAGSSLGVAGVAENVVEHHDEVVSGNIQSATPAGGSPVVHGDSPVEYNSGMVRDDGQNPQAISIPASGTLSQCVSTWVHDVDPSGVYSTSGAASSDQSEHDVDVFSDSVDNVGCSTSASTSMATTTSTTLSPPTLVTATAGTRKRRPALNVNYINVNYITGLNSFGGLKAHNSVVSLGQPVCLEQSFVKVVISLKASLKGNGRADDALSSTYNAVGEIFNIAMLQETKKTSTLF
ncbi:hypothetical protein GQ457_01G037100 [Hibiscus cannabinus]